MSTTVNISQIDPNTLIEIDLDQIDSSLISSTGEDAQFDTTQDTIELYYLDSNKNPTKIDFNFVNWRISKDSSKGDSTTLNSLELDPEKDGKGLGLYNGFGYIIYQFVNNKLGSNSQNYLYIDQISSDRTELVLKSNTISGIELETGIEDLKTQLQENTEYFQEFYIAFQDGNKEIATNIEYNQPNINTDTVLVKLYRPLPDEYDIKSTLWIQSLKADPVAYKVDFSTTFDETTRINPLRSPNFNISTKAEQSKTTEYKNYNQISTTNLTSSLSQIGYLLNQNQAQLSVDYTNFENFVHFSSAKKRLENFYYKASLIESYQNSIDTLLTASASGYRSGSVKLYQNYIDTIIKEFDGYDYFLYYNSGSKSWPKTNSTKPYTLASTGSAAVLTWYGSDDETSGNYGGQILSASLFDNGNQDNLTFTIPSQLRDDPDNLNYLIYVEMVGQVLDELFLYTKHIPSKYSSDNRLDYGSSKDLIADVLRSLGLKLYENNFTSADLFSGLLGLTPSGSTLLLPDISTTYPVTESGLEYIETIVSASNESVSLDDLNKSIYKRLYHNLPALIKKKGTLAGLRLLINTYGIPDTILRINEFGGKDKVNSNDWDYWQRKQNYAAQLNGTSEYIRTYWKLSGSWAGGVSSIAPNTAAFRFKTDEVTPSSGPTNVSQSLWSLGNSGGTTTYLNTVLTYTGSAGISGSYSSSVVDPYYQYGTLTFFPDYTDTTQSASVYLPFFNGGWWSVMITRESDDYTIYAKNSFYNGDTGTSLGFQASSSITAVTSYWTQSGTYGFVGDTMGTYNRLSGSFQELRYYAPAISESVFDDFVMNPDSIEGNSINSGPTELAFRAALGGELYTGSLSIHPKSSGFNPTESFAFGIGNNFDISCSFSSNTEVQFLDQPAVGIKNRISDKIRLGSNNIYGTTLSNQKSLIQHTPGTEDYTRNINYLEVGFSPQNEINDDIINQIGYFNIGDYIGDPRQISSSNYTYTDLEALKNAYFEKYSKSYDWNDYLRLIKFYDNSLFKMLKDFIPARTSAATGATIKQTLLERNRQRPAQVSWTRPEYTASIKPQSRDYETGSIQVFTGGPAGSLTIPQGGIETLFNSGSLTFSTGLYSYFYNLLDNPTNEPYTYTISFDVPSGYSDGGLMLFDSTGIVTNPLTTPFLFSASMADITGTSQKFTAEVRNGISISYFFDSINYLILTNLKVEHDLYDNAQGFPTSSINGLLGIVSTPFTTTPYYQGDFPGTTIDVVEGKLQDNPLLGESYRLSISDLQDIDVTVSQELRVDNFAFNITQSVPFDTDAKNSLKYNTSTYTFTPEFSNIVDYNLTLQGTYSCSLGGPTGTQSLIADLSINGVTGSYPTVLFTVDNTGPTSDFTGSFTQSILISQDSLLELGEFKVVIYEGNPGTAPFFPLTASFQDSRWTVTTENLVAKSTYYLDPAIYAEQNFPGNLNEFSDYNAIYNNVYSNRVSTKYFDVDYTNGALNPSNFGPIISQSALYAQIQDSNYDNKSAFFELRYGGTKNNTTSYNTGSGLNAQYSAGVYVAYYSSIGGNSVITGPYAGYSQAQLTVEYLIAPDGTLIQLTPQDEVSVKIFEQNFLSNTFEEGQNQVYGISFTQSAFPAPVFKNGLTLDVSSSVLPVFTGYRTGSEGGYTTDNVGGILYPAGIEGTSAADLPFRARQILKEARLI